jgi:ribose transport system permease protein
MLGPVAEYVGLLAVLVILIAFFAMKTEHFCSRENFQTIANQIPATVIVVVGMTYVLIIAGIDLSVGSVLGFSGAVLGVLVVGTRVAPTLFGHVLFDVQLHFSLTGAIAAALLVGLLCGLFNGMVSVRWTIPSFIVTLGMLEIARGAAHLLTGSQTQYIGSAVGAIAQPSVIFGLHPGWPLRPLVTFAADGGQDLQLAIANRGDWSFALSLPFLVAVALVIFAQLVLSRSIFGRYLVAIGTNEEAVRLSGINPRPIKVAVFAISGLLAGIGGIISTARFESANPNEGTGLELAAIAAVVVGGTSLMGGRGSVVASFIGVLIIAVLGNGLAALGARDETKRIVTGLVIIAAAVLDYYRRRLSQRES